MEERYLSFKSYLKRKYKKRVQKITLTLPFTCPNIDGTKSYGGCIYCREGSRPFHLSPEVSLDEQIRRGIERAEKKYGKDILFFLYYQSYTNTYGDLEYLKEIYDRALKFDKVVGFSVGTRPDCVPEEVLNLLKQYREKGLEVWVEVGLQSANFSTLKFINRAHGVSDFIDAVFRIKEKGLLVCTHVILGLPNESKEDFLETAKLLSLLPIDGVKIHPIYVVKGTKLYKLYLEGKFKPLELEDYINYVCDFLELLPKNVVVQRLTAEEDPKLLVAPSYCTYKEKSKVLNLIREELKRRGTYQGAREGKLFNRWYNLLVRR